MQNNEHSNHHPVRKFFQEKGYYIVLFLCICAVGISGYLFVSSTISEKNTAAEQTLSVATSAAVPSGTAGSSTQRPAKSDSAGSEKPKQTLTQEPSAAASDADEKIRSAAAQIRVWPLSGEKTNGYCADRLSYNATTQDWRTHEGVDLACVNGTPVRAACAGTVTAVYDDDYLGSTVVISHTDGYTTQYSNLAAMPTVSAGSIVEAGDIIGSVGSTAMLEIADEPHLHFSVCRNGESIDPNQFIG
ncbi:MAG: M23 family metallopeptidase [Clostridia bacterium]|nr:M23 family metallopeptidase [Clostridia bacterium]